jgi:hypothetical protein
MDRPLPLAPGVVTTATAVLSEQRKKNDFELLQSRRVDNILAW